MTVVALLRVPLQLQQLLARLAFLLLPHPLLATLPQAPLPCGKLSVLQAAVEEEEPLPHGLYPPQALLQQEEERAAARARAMPALTASQEVLQALL